MNKSFFFVLVILGVIIFNCFSCGKEQNNPPSIVFRTSALYVYKDTTLTQGTIFNIGVNASKRGINDLLTTGKISRSINGGADSTIQEMTLLTQNFQQFYSYIAGDSGNTEKYTFIFGNQAGMTNSISLTVKDSI